MRRMNREDRQRGFTLPELIVAASAVLVVLIVLFVFVHPRDFSIPTRNNERWLGVALLMQSLTKYYDRHGSLPNGLSDKPKTIGNTADDGIDLCPALVPGILKDIPIDPKDGVQLPDGVCIGSKDDPSLYVYDSRYTIKRAKDGTVTIAAPQAEAGQTISLSHKFN